MLEGNGGADTFVYGSGADVIEDFRGADVIELSGSLGVSNFADVLALSSVVGGGDDVLIDFGGGDTLRLEDVNLTALNAGDFIFA
jgi:hypothetical protein